MPAGVLEAVAEALAEALAKAVLLLALLGTVIAASTATASAATISPANPGNVNLQGTRKPGDQLLFEYRVTRRAKPFKVITEAVEYPMTTGQKPGVITMVEVRSPKRRPDEVHIKSGGVGERSATILFKSARGRGLDYTVNIFGFPANAATAKQSTAAPEAAAAPEASGGSGGAGATEGDGDKDAGTTTPADAES